MEILNKVFKSSEAHALELSIDKMTQAKLPTNQLYRTPQSFDANKKSEAQGRISTEELGRLFPPSEARPLVLSIDSVPKRKRPVDERLLPPSTAHPLGLQSNASPGLPRLQDAKEKNGSLLSSSGAKKPSKKMEE